MERMTARSQKAGAMPQAFLERLPGDRATRQMQERLEFLEHCGDAASRMEVFHVVLARRFEVHEDGGGLAEAVQMMQVDGQSDATRNGREVDDGIGGAPDGQQHPERILDRFTRHDLIQGEARRRKPDRLHPRGLRNPEAVRVHRGDSGASRQTHAERFREARHRAGGTHHGTGARRHRQVVLDFHDPRFGYFAGAVAGPEAAAIGACAKPFASIPSRHHRSHDKLNRGNRRRHSPHDLRGARLVAATDQHHRAHGLARIISSTSIDIRLRNTRLVGLRKTSPSEMVGKSKGKPPEARTPRLTASTSSGVRRWQLLNPLAEVAIPMMGRSSISPE